jgi:hypothetical protein
MANFILPNPPKVYNNKDWEYWRNKLQAGILNLNNIITSNAVRANPWALGGSGSTNTDSLAGNHTVTGGTDWHDIASRTVYMGQQAINFSMAISFTDTYVSSIPTRNMRGNYRVALTDGVTTLGGSVVKDTTFITPATSPQSDSGTSVISSILSVWPNGGSLSLKLQCKAEFESVEPSTSWEANYEVTTAAITYLEKPISGVNLV